MVKNKNCIYCGKELTGRQTMYCSANCRNKELYRVQQSFNERHKRYCLLCGKELTSLRRIYCSKECSTMAARLREQDRIRQEKEEELEMKQFIEERMHRSEKRREVKMTFAQIEKGMMETGLSYGEYVARYDA